MSWITWGEGGGNGAGRNNTDEGDIGGDVGTFKGVPLCAAAMCSAKGMPPPRLPQPGLDCVRRDAPCLPCDIVNLKLRVAVAGVKVKRAVAECQKRYFCRVWNLLFGWLFPGYKPRRCLNLKSGDAEVACRQKPKRKKAESRQLPYGADPRGAISRPEDMKVGRRRHRQSPLDDRWPGPRTQGRPPSAARKQGRRQPTGGDLRYNIWDMPMLDNIKKEKRGQDYKSTRKL